MTNQRPDPGSSHNNDPHVQLWRELSKLGWKAHMIGDHNLRDAIFDVAQLAADHASRRGRL